MLAPSIIFAANDEESRLPSYAVNLMAMIGRIDLEKIKRRSEFAEGKLFISKKRIRNKIMNLLRVGPYPSIAKARRVALSVNKYYKGAFVTKIKSKKNSSARPINRTKPSVKNNVKRAFKSSPISNKSAFNTRFPSNRSNNPKTNIILSPDEEVQKRQYEMIELARAALTRNEMRKAIALFQTFLERENNLYTQEAHELLGLSRERLGQTAQAKDQYELYLYLYPEGEGSDRVKQRLQVLLTANDNLPSSLSEAAGNQSKNNNDWKIYGGVNQYYRVLSEADSDLYSFATITGRKRTENWNFRSQFTATQTSPIDGFEDPTLRLSELYIEVNQVSDYLAFKLGRQRSNKGGVFTRFDGAAITAFSMNDHVFNLIIGAPVENSKHDFINKHKQLFGLNVDSTFFEGALSINTYYIQQNVDAVVDRQAIGLLSTYYNEGFNLFSVLDYDVSYQDLNIFMLNGSWSAREDLTYFFNFHHHKSPFLLTTNALQGQAVGTIQDLGVSLTDDEVFQLAKDHTATINLINGGFYYLLDKDTRIRGGITITSTEETVGSTNVLPIPASAGDYSVFFQLIKNNYLDKNDISILQFQYSETLNSTVYKSKVSSQIPIKTYWEVEPQGLITITKNLNGANNNVLSAGIKAKYNYSKDVTFDIELSGDLSNDNIAFENESIPNIYFAMGYQWYF